MTSDAASQGLVLLETATGVATITINRPEKYNALNSDVLVALKARAQEVSADGSVRCVILTGAGDKSFVAGADIGEMQGLDAPAARVFAEKGHAALDALETCRVPVIAAVNGFALGGGCEIALACDFIHASQKARFGQPEVGLGVIPGFGGTQRLARRVGIAWARELIYTGRTIGAPEALRIGLVNAVHDPEELLPKVRELAATIAGNGPFAVAAAKRVMREGEELPLAPANALEREAFARCFGTEDQSEGMSAFLEKRDARFTGA